MSEKITAMFGADVSEVEAKMLVATRATKAYENAVRGIAKAGGGDGMAKNMERTNGALVEISKKLTAGRILESVLGGVGIGSGFALAEKAAGLIASYWENAAKSAESIAASSDRATDSVMKRIGLRETDEQALTKAKARSAKADAALRADSGESPEESANLKEAAEAAALALETLQKKARERTKAAADKASAENKEREERDLTLTKQRLSRVDKMEEDAREKKNKDAEEDAAAAKKRAEDVAKTQAELDQMVYDRKWELATKEQKLAQALKEGQKAKAEDMFERTAESALKLEKARQKYAKLLEEGKSGAGGEKGDSLATGGRTRNEKGQLTRNGVVISEEDAARTDKTKADNALEAKQITKEEHTSLLKEIRDSLKPRGK